MTMQKKIITNLGIYFGIQIIMQVLTSNLVGKENILKYSIINIIFYLIIISLLYFFNNKELKRMQIDFKKNGLKYLIKNCWIWLLGLGLMLLTNYLIQKTGIGIANNEKEVRNLINNYFIYSMIVTCLLAPIIEEIVFRLSFNGIKNQYLFLAITSFLFGLVHIIGSNFIYIIPYAILGLSYGIIYLRTKNICSSISFHMIHNIMTFVLILLNI